MLFNKKKVNIRQYNKKFSSLDYLFKLKHNITFLYFLNFLYGISYSIINRLIIKFGVSSNISIEYISLSTFNNVLKFLDLYILPKSDCFLKNNIFLAKFQLFHNYKGFRHIRGLPVRGQRTCSNAMTCRSFVFHKKILNLTKFFKIINDF